MRPFHIHLTSEEWNNTVIQEKVRNKTRYYYIKLYKIDMNIKKILNEERIID